MKDPRDDMTMVELTLHPPGCAHRKPRTDDVAESHGPSKVASPAYREGWDSIFGKKREAGQA